MKINYYVKIASATGLILTSAAQADIGNSIVFNDTENNRVIALDRINLATHPAHKREAMLREAEENYGEGRVMEKPKSYGAFSLDRQQDSCGSLTGKSLEIEFAPLAAEPEISKATPTTHKTEGMKKIDHAESVYHVLSPGSWNTNYGGETWWTPLSQWFARTQGSGIQQQVCNGVNNFSYNTRSGQYAFWNKGEKIAANAVTGVEVDVASRKVSGVEFKLQNKTTSSWSITGYYYDLWSDSWVDENGIRDFDGTRVIEDYFEKTLLSVQFVGYQAKATYDLNTVKADLGAVPTYSAIFQTSWGSVTTNGSALRSRQQTHVGCTETSNAFTITVEAGVQVKVKLGGVEGQGTMVLGYNYQSGSAIGTRDFDYYCYRHDTQTYEHDSYRKHYLYIKADAKIKIGTMTVTTTLVKNLLAQTDPGRFRSENARHLRNSALDYSM